MARDLFAEACELNAPTGKPSRLDLLLDSLDGDERAEVIDLVWHDGRRDAPSHRAIADVLTRHYGATFGTFSQQLVQRQRQKPRPT